LLQIAPKSIVYNTILDNKLLSGLWGENTLDPGQNSRNLLILKDLLRLYTIYFGILHKSCRRLTDFAR